MWLEMYTHIVKMEKKENIPSLSEDVKQLELYTTGRKVETKALDNISRTY